MSHKLKLFIFVSLEMIAIVTVFLLILFAGKKTYTVTFDPNGGEVLSGSLVQNVTRGQSATAPVVVKDGCYLLTWSDNYTRVSKNVVTKAVWEYSTTAGIQYEVLENSNYCLISSCYKELSGTVYIGAYYNGLKVLGIKENAFEGCSRIENIYLLDGLLSIGDNAFAGCESLTTINIPETVENIGSNAFLNCKSLTSINIPTKVRNIGDNAFSGCESLEEVIIPSSVVKMGKNVFDNDLKIKVELKEDAIPETWNLEWYTGEGKVIYDYLNAPLEEEVTATPEETLEPTPEDTQEESSKEPGKEERMEESLEEQEEVNQTNEEIIE